MKLFSPTSLRLGVLALFWLASVPRAAAGETVVIRLGTILPSGTGQHVLLQELGERWRRRFRRHRETGALSRWPPRRRVRDGEKTPHQTDQLRPVHRCRPQRNRSGRLGLQMMPLKFRTLGGARLRARKDPSDARARLHAKGFEVLFWADAGWVRFFSKEAATRPVEFQPMKMFTWAGDATQLSIMQTMGYQPVPLETSDILLGLNTDMITTVPLPPLLALAARINGPAPHMLEMNWVPIVGACVVRTDVWEKIPPELRAKLLASAEEIGTRMRTRGREEGDEAVRAMQQHGLQVHPMTPQSTREWQAQVEKLYPAIRGSLVPAEIFDAVDHHLAEFRAKSQP